MSTATPSFVEELNQASQAHAVHDRVELIQRAVANQMRLLDRRTNVTFTGYFNHTYAPDMILTDFDGQWERELFVRLTANPRWLAEEYPRSNTSSPLIVPVADLPSPEGDMSPVDVLVGITANNNGWIADPSALTRLGSNVGANPITGLLSQAMVRGGVGVDTARTVDDLSSRTVEGFDAAAATERDGVQSALSALHESLDAPEAERFVRVLRAVWIGHGGQDSGFPEASTLEGLSVSDINYLLASIQEGNPAFWRSVGRGLNHAQLPQIATEAVQSPNFQHLVAGCLPWLQSKALLARTGETMQFDAPPSNVRWTVEENCLSLRGSNWVCFLAAATKQELPIPSPKAREVHRGHGSPPGLKPDSAQARVNAAKARVGAVVWANSRFEHTVSPHDPESTRTIPLDAIGVDSQTDRITQLTVSGSGIPSVNVDFEESTASGQTTAIFSTAPLLRLTIPLLIPVPESDQVALDGLLPVGSSGASNNASPQLEIDEHPSD